jgi:cytochrome c-type biogenesis protein CcmH
LTRRVLLSALAALAPALLAAQSAPPTDPRAVVGPPRGQPLSGAALDARAEEVAALLRCPVCQGLSVADSPSSMAQNMKRQVRELLEAGYDQEQILAYFERSYGEFVRLEPPLRGVNWLVWGAPVAGLLAGLGVVAWAFRRGQRASQVPLPSAERAAVAPEPDALPDDPSLAAYVLKVRELAYGWPGGVRPKQGSA